MNRHLRESGDFDLSKEMITSALTICEQHPNELAEEMADSLFSLASLLNSHNQQKAALPYAERHFAQRMKVGLSRSPCPMKRAVATAHSELALSYMQNNRIKEGLELSREAQFLLEQRPEFRNGERWPEFPMMHQAIMLLELGSIAEAEELLLKTIEWRERRYGPNDTNSFKLLLVRLYCGCADFMQAWLRIRSPRKSSGAPESLGRELRPSPTRLE